MSKRRKKWGGFDVSLVLAIAAIFFTIGTVVGQRSNQANPKTQVIQWR
jgi:hypothetical protein